MIRVLHCVAGMNYGGYETFIMNIYRSVDRTKVQFDFLSSFDGVYDAEILHKGGKIIKIPFITKCGPVVYRRNVDRFFNEHSEYQLIHSHMDKFSGLIMQCAKSAGVKTRIAHSHSTKNEGGVFYNLVKNYYGTKINKNATDLFACSVDAAAWMFGKQSNRAVIVKNGIDVGLYLPNMTDRDLIRNDLGLTGQFVVGHLGRFAAPKNHAFLIDVFIEVKKIQKNAKLLLVGTGDLMPQTQAKVKQLGLEHDVIFYGTSETIPRLMQAMDVFVFPSLFEGLGIALIEAQAAGLPCIVSNRVPAEANVTNTLDFLSFEDGAVQWAERIISYQGVEKTDHSQMIVQNGYDIKSTAEFLQKFYLGTC